MGNLTVQSLTDMGYVPVPANSADEALAQLGRHAARFDVVFTDVVMPGMGGIHLALRIHDTHPDLPVLLASGYRHVLAQNGTCGLEILHKPYSIEQLSRLLCKVTDGQRGERIMAE